MREENGQLAKQLAQCHRAIRDLEQENVYMQTDRKWLNDQKHLVEADALRAQTAFLDVSKRLEILSVDYKSSTRELQEQKRIVKVGPDIISCCSGLE